MPFVNIVKSKNVVLRSPIRKVCTLNRCDSNSLSELARRLLNFRKHFASADVDKQPSIP